MLVEARLHRRSAGRPDDRDDLAGVDEPYVNRLARFLGQIRGQQTSRPDFAVTRNQISAPVRCRPDERKGIEHVADIPEIAVELRDIPGALAALVNCIENAGGGIEHARHHRFSARGAVENVIVEFILQTRGREHAEEILAALEAAGYPARLSETP